jgi:hypothetical protein
MFHGKMRCSTLKFNLIYTQLEYGEIITMQPKKEIIGVLKSIQVNEGSRSAGPKYYLSPKDDDKERRGDVLIRKQTKLWESDPNLEPYVGKSVKIIGEIIETKSSITVDYEKIEEIA